MELNNTCGRAGGKKNAHVAATTPTPPIAHNAPHMKGCGIHPGGCLALHSARNRRDRLPQRHQRRLLLPALRVTISPRTLEKGSVELKGRREKESSLVALGEAVASIVGAIRS